MGANKFNPKSAAEQGDGDNRIVDQRTEDGGDILERVREEQRRFSAAINSLAVAVSEYAQLLTHIRQLRVERVEERSRRFEELRHRVKAELSQSDNSYQQVDYDYSGSEEYDQRRPHKNKGLSR